MSAVSDLNAIKENWLKRGSGYIVFVAFVSLFFYVTKGNSYFTLGGIEIRSLYFAFFLLLIFAIYTLVLVYKSKLPKAKKGALSVLFVIEAETDDLVNAAKHKLVNNFEDIVAGNNTANFEATCISKSRIKNINTKDKEQLQTLLQKTNCMFYVGVNYKVDDANHAENFEMSINTGVIHPLFVDQVEEILARDLSSLTSTVSQQRFHKSNLLEIFDFTAQTLSYICQYMLGLVYLFSNNTDNARKIFSGIQSQLNAERQNIAVINRLKNLTRERIYATEAQSVEIDILKFEATKDLENLQNAKESLNRANSIYPDTYWYNTNMAYIYVALEHNGRAAKACIDKCRQQNRQEEWKYSDAFLCAYLNLPPQVIIAKYKKATLVKTYNILRIADYIEYIIEQEPQMHALHLASGLVYEAMGDTKMMKYHFNIYLKTIPDENRTVNLLTAKMEQAICDIECDYNCEKCIAS